MRSGRPRAGSLKGAPSAKIGVVIREFHRRVSEAYRRFEKPFPMTRFGALKFSLYFVVSMGALLLLAGGPWDAVWPTAVITAPTLYGLARIAQAVIRRRDGSQGSST